MSRDCVLNEGLPCTECGECAKCDLDASKLCDNCMRCVKSDADYLAVEIDEIVAEDAEEDDG